MIATVPQAARAILLAREPAAKAEAAASALAAWEAGALATGPALPLPDRPARPARPLLLPPAAMPKRGRAGSPRARFALLHALAHIELNAIDLAADIAGRFGHAMPAAFSGDWLKVAAEEAGHFLMLEGLLQASGGAYGDLPAHDGLWQAAQATSADLPARLALVPQVLEARGLDVTPAMIARFEACGDTAAAAVLSRIYADEIGHVATGNRWFRFLADESGTDPAECFRDCVRAHFRGGLKPPFNDSARSKAGLPPQWYYPLCTACDPSA
ncbi:MAG: ferritin-like domain-containing protein [Sphingomonadaceae bacterium]